MSNNGMNLKEMLIVVSFLLTLFFTSLAVISFNFIFVGVALGMLTLVTVINGIFTGDIDTRSLKESIFFIITILGIIGIVIGKFVTQGFVGDEIGAGFVVAIARFFDMFKDLR